MEELEVGRSVRDMEQRMRDAFDVFDVNRSGYLDADEVMGILTRVGGTKPMTQHDAAEFIKLFDCNEDQKMQIDECKLALP
jgi:Ca2+-binding EF-hand superfamily protein